MRVTATQGSPLDGSADTIIVGLIEDEPLEHDVDGVLAALLDSGEAKARFKHLAVAHAGARRLVAVGLGARDELDDERLRVATALAVKRAAELGATDLAWAPPRAH